MSALEDNITLILNINISLTAVAHCGRHEIPSSCLIVKGVNTESELGNAASDIKGEVKEHVFGKWVRRTYNQGPVCSWGAPLVLSRPFNVVLRAHPSLCMLEKGFQ